MKGDPVYPNKIKKDDVTEVKNGKLSEPQITLITQMTPIKHS